MQFKFFTMLAVLAVGSVGCGGDDDEKPASPQAARTTATQSGAIPSPLVGTWEKQLKLSEIESAPNELNEATPAWKLQIARTGGIDDGPTFAISNPGPGTIVSPTPSVSGNRLTLQDAEPACPGGDIHYTYAITGDRLTLKPATGKCGETGKEEVIDDILSTRSWRRASG